MRLGPIAGATLIVPDLQRALLAYVAQLRLFEVSRAPVTRQRALDMGETALIDAPGATLALSRDGAACLYLIEVPAAPKSNQGQPGWTRLDFGVSMLGALRERLVSPEWTPVSGAEPLSAVPEACALFLGPAGEHVSFHQLPERTGRGTAPDGEVEVLLGISLSVSKVPSALAFYQGLGLIAGRHTATSGVGELRGGQQIEFLLAANSQNREACLPAGIRMVSFARSDRQGRRLEAADDPSARILAGPAREAIELV
jgi:hypothetical protein